MNLLLATLLFSASLGVPRATAPVIDGTIGAEEWKPAVRVPLTNGGEALLQHDGTFLYVAISGTRTGIASFCTTSGEDVRILHASAALGTAVFRDGKATRGFTWTNRNTADTEARKKFLDAEQWFANATPRGSLEREYQIAIAGRREIPIVLAFMSFAPNEAQGIHYWPADVKDACAGIDLAAGKTDGVLTFEPKTWGVLRFN